MTFINDIAKSDDSMAVSLETKANISAAMLSRSLQFYHSFHTNNHTNAVRVKPKSNSIYHQMFLTYISRTTIGFKVRKRYYLYEPVKCDYSPMY